MLIWFLNFITERQADPELIAKLIPTYISSQTPGGDSSVEDGYTGAGASPSETATSSAAAAATAAALARRSSSEENAVSRSRRSSGGHHTSETLQHS